MPDISIRIVADPSGAKQGLKDVQNNLQKLGATMKDVMKVSAKGFRPFGNETDASKDLEKYSLRIKAMANATNAFVSGLKRPEDQLKAWRSQLSFFRKEYMELLTQGKFSFDGDDRIGNQMLGNIEETEKRIAEIRKAMEKEKTLSRKAREEADAEQLELLGTRYQKVTAEIEKHRKVLNALLVEKHRQGKASDDLKQKIDAEVVSIRKLTKEQEKASRTSFLSKMLSIAKNIMGFQMAIALFRKTTTALTQTLRESVQAAAEAEQIYSKLGTVFEGVAGSMDKARDVAASIGVANSTAASALSTVGDLLQAQGMGATESLKKASQWVRQFQDIIAFKDINMSLEEFAQNFMSGAAGNLRNFRTFGSIVKESAVQAELLKRNLDGLTGSQLELAKMTIRAEMALEQQANAMGATQREWDTALSVSRRLNEAWKEFKENLGDTLIRFVNPIRRGITGILEDANKANRAMKGEAVYTGVNEVNGDDYKLFRSRLLRLKGMNDIQTRSGAETYLKALKNLPTKETLDFIFQDMEGSMTERERERIRPVIDSIIEAIKAEREQKAAMDATAEALAIANDNLEKYREGLQDIKGVGSLGEIILGDVDNLGKGKDLLTRLAANSLGSQDVGTFVDRLEKAFDPESATNGGYKAWLDSIRQLYTLVETEDPGSVLAERLLRLYEEVLNKQKEFNDELERGKNFATALENIEKGTNDYRSKTAQVGMTDLGKALYALEEQHKKDLELADTANAVTAVNEAYELQKDAIYDYYSALSMLEAETEDATEAEEARAALAELENKKIQDLIQAEQELKDTIKGDFVSMFGKAGTFTEALGAFAQNHDMKDAQGLQNAKDLWSALFAILKETKAFQKVLEGVDTALTGLDSILEPFIPYIEMVNRQTQQLMQVLRPLIPVMKVFSSILTIVQVSIIHSTTVIAEAMTWVLNLADELLYLINKPAKKTGSLLGGIVSSVVPGAIGDALGGAISGMLGGATGAAGKLANEFAGFMEGLDLPTTESLLKDMSQTLEDIWNTEEEIRFNTEDSDLSKILEELNYLYAHGIIDANTYNARVNRVTGGNYLDTVGSGGIWNNGFSAGARTNNISITINGAGLNKDELDAVLSSALSRVTGNTVHVDTRRASFAY